MAFQGDKQLLPPVPAESLLKQRQFCTKIQHDAILFLETAPSVPLHYRVATKHHNMSKYMHLHPPID